MPKKDYTKTGRSCRVTFELPAEINAQTAFLCGDFNQWSPTVHPMKKDPSGVWKKITMLYPGRYEYRFRIDGQWENDPANHRTCPNCFGTYNNVVIVPQAPSSK